LENRNNKERDLTRRSQREAHPSATFRAARVHREELVKEKARRGDAPGLSLREGELFVFEGEGEVEDDVADGDAEGKLVGARVAGEPEFAGGFLARGKIGGFQSHGAHRG